MTSLSRAGPILEPHPCSERNKVCSLVYLMTLVLLMGQPVGHLSHFKLTSTGGKRII